ncbi:hypothetical protein H632_c75p1 [Helicosporidium sp. ATCC 50920]|nr:hypothetical protein H632_c75p1 [Helicosporidium sp. ATCC 50920]|eukprot:KDD76889.1 hypothetical protein H632_c75p1 [Helicosporidium sp. ATCC 50920]
MAKAVRVAAASGNAALESAPPTRTLTAFEQRLHAVCKAIPQGKVTTYGAMAKVLESSPRAVGQALRRNPYAPVVPCHRVIAADLSIGGFKGVTGTHTDTIKSKRTMLCEEGVVFDADSFNVAKGSCLGSDELAEAVKVAGVKLTKHDST